MQIILKDKKVVCVTTEPYPNSVVRAMKQAGYKVKEVKFEEYIKSGRA